jgi:diadenosine tetraphosphatase ApaH/serine/threonine PP2A family protein phosphatase
MAIAIISDIHSNIEALDTVLRDIESLSGKHDIRDIHCLGDIIGYGPKPVQCVERVREVCSSVVMGSHEDAICFIPDEVFQKNDIYNRVYAVPSFIWTREMIKWHNPELFEYLAKLPYNSLPETEGQKEIAEVHGTLCTDVNEMDIEMQVEKHPNNPPHGPMECSSMNLYSTYEEADGDESTFKTDCLTRTFNSLINLDRKVCFIGHLHEPQAYGCAEQYEPIPLGFGVDMEQPFSYEVTVEKDRKYVFNVGSVGQPRDGDTRACYGIYTGDKMIFRKVPYDYDITMMKMLIQPFLSKQARTLLAARLARGQ